MILIGVDAVVGILFGLLALNYEGQGDQYAATWGLIVSGILITHATLLTLWLL